MPENRLILRSNILLNSTKIGEIMRSERAFSVFIDVASGAFSSKISARCRLIAFSSIPANISGFSMIFEKRLVFS